MFAAVDVTLEGRTLFGDLAQLLERKNLEAAAVGQDRARPVHEGMKPAKTAHPFRTRPQHQMIGVAQHNVGPGITHLTR